MNKAQETKLMMYYSVDSVSNRFKSVWVNDGPFSDSINLFNSNVLLIKKNRDIQIAELTGITVDKRQKQENLCVKVLFTANRLRSFAHTTGNGELAKSVTFTASKLHLIEHTELSGIANFIIAKAKEHLASLGAYGITQGVISDLQNSEEIFSCAISRPRDARVQKMNATETIKQLFAENDLILKNRLDMDIEVFKEICPEFYKEFKLSRFLIGSSHGKIVLKANVIENTSNIPLHNVVFSFRNNNEKSASVVKKTSVNGQFYIKNLPKGEYEVKVSKVGFIEQIIKVIIAEGEMTSLDIVMEAA